MHICSQWLLNLQSEWSVYLLATGQQDVGTAATDDGPEAAAAGIPTTRWSQPTEAALKPPRIVWCQCRCQCCCCGTGTRECCRPSRPIHAASECCSVLNTFCLLLAHSGADVCYRLFAFSCQLFIFKDILLDLH